MRIAIIKNLDICEEKAARHFFIQIREMSCDIIVFYGRLFKFMHSIDIDLIKLFHEILDSFASATRIIFSECCIFPPTATCIHAEKEYEDFAIVEDELSHRGRLLRPGIHDGENFWPFAEIPTKIITMYNDDVGSLPNLEVQCNIELHYQNCHDFAIEFARNKYGAIDKFVDLDVPANFTKSRPEWRLTSLEWEDVFCYRKGMIDFAAADKIISVMGKNGAGKSSIIKIMILSFPLSKKHSPSVIRKGCSRALIKCTLIHREVEYTITTTISPSETKREIYPNEDIVGILRGVPAAALYFAQNRSIPSAFWDVAAANEFLRRICNISLHYDGKNIRVQDQHIFGINKCSVGQQSLINLALSITAKCPRQQVIFIDEMLDRLDNRHFAKCLEHISAFYDQIFIIGHRKELLDLSRVYVAADGTLNINNYSDNTDISAQ